MKISLKKSITLLVLLTTAFLYLPAHAQTVIDGTTVTTNALYVVGVSDSSNTLLITNIGVLSLTNGVTVDAIGTVSSIIGSNTTATLNSAIVTDAGSIWTNAGQLFIGWRGASNSLTISNGGSVFNEFGALGYNTSSSNNTSVVTGNGSVWSNQTDLYVGRFGQGNTLTISNGGSVFNRFGFMGNNNSSSNNTSVVTGNGSVWSNRSELRVGSSGQGNTLTISNGGSVFNSAGYLGANTSSSSNTSVVTGDGSVWSNSSSLLVGWSGQGNTLTISNGGSVFNSVGYLGLGTGSSNNTSVVTGNGSVWSNLNELRVGSSGQGNTLTISNGGSVYATNMIAGFNASSTNNLVTMSGAGSQLVVTNATGTSTYNIRRGTNVQNGGTLMTDHLIVTNSVGAYTLNGGTAIVGQATISNGAAFVVGNGTDTAYFRQTQAGVTNTFADGITINDGGTFSFAGTVTNLITFNGGTLAGTGTLTTALTIGAGAVISPGNSPGTIVGTNMTFASGGTYLWQINDFTGTQGADPGWDWMNLSGALDITASVGNEFNINLTSLTTFNTAGDAANFDDMQDYNLTILTAVGGITGFNASAFNLNMGAFSNAFTGTWAISQNGNDLVLNYTAVIPEPSTYALLALGAICAGVILRRKRKPQIHAD